MSGEQDPKPVGLLVAERESAERKASTELSFLFGQAFDRQQGSCGIVVDGETLTHDGHHR